MRAIGAHAAAYPPAAGQRGSHARRRTRAERFCAGSPRRAGGARRSGGLCASTVLALAVAVALSARPAHASPEPALKTLIDTVNAAQRAVKGVEGEQGSAARRKLINIVTAAQTKYFHLPLVNCFNYTNFVTAPPDGGPLCCALTPMACAARCDATPGCLAFKYAWYVRPAPSAHAATGQPLPASAPARARPLALLRGGASTSVPRSSAPARLQALRCRKHACACATLGRGRSPAGAASHVLSQHVR